MKRKWTGQFGWFYLSRALDSHQILFYLEQSEFALDKMFPGFRAFLCLDH